MEVVRAVVARAHLDGLLELSDHVLLVQALLTQVAHPLVHGLVAARRADLLAAVVVIVGLVVTWVASFGGARGR